MRHFHSIKGNSSVFSLKSISTLAHQVENNIQEKQSSGEDLSLQDIKENSEKLENIFYLSLKEYQKVSGLKLDSLNERTVELKLSNLLKFLNYLRSTKQEPIIQKYSSLFLEDLRKKSLYVLKRRSKLLVRNSNVKSIDSISQVEKLLFINFTTKIL